MELVTSTLFLCCKYLWGRVNSHALCYRLNYTCIYVWTLSAAQTHSVRYCPGIILVYLKGITKHLNRDSRRSGWDSKSRIQVSSVTGRTRSITLSPGRIGWCLQCLIQGVTIQNVHSLTTCSWDYYESKKLKSTATDCEENKNMVKLWISCSGTPCINVWKQTILYRHNAEVKERFVLHLTLGLDISWPDINNEYNTGFIAEIAQSV
jgi:hypothetical protein